MSPKAEHIPLLVNIGQRVRIIGHENFYWKPLGGHMGRVIGKAGPNINGTGREHTIYHVKLDVPVAGYPPDIWVNRCDFERV
jgi:hypothetical protein